LRYAAVLALAAASGCASWRLSDRRVPGSGRIGVEDVLKAGREIHEALDVSPELEKAMGREAAASLAARHGFYDEEETLRYVNLVGLAVARASERSGVEYRFGILNTEDLNAYAAPGGYIFVTKGLLKVLTDEAMLAGVLAHEIQHVERRHAVNALRKGNLVRAGTRLTQDRLQSSEGLRLASEAIVDLMERGFDRSDEREADVAGVALLARAGYDPTGLPRALEEHDALAATAHGNAFTRRHPSFKSRLEAIASVRGLPETGAVNKKRYLKHVSF
ncbi:MAG: M48 family metalloprotease, partial [Elusimicrobia bacterium]|nr:M48 family metalloprotease [Elusimicrobiota bacterium]